MRHVAILLPPDVTSDQLALFSLCIVYHSIDNNIMSNKPTYAAVAAPDSATKAGKNDPPADAPPPCKYSLRTIHLRIQLTRQTPVPQALNHPHHSQYQSHTLIKIISNQDHLSVDMDRSRLVGHLRLHPKSPKRGPLGGSGYLSCGHG